MTQWNGAVASNKMVFYTLEDVPYYLVVAMLQIVYVCGM